MENILNPKKQKKEESYNNASPYFIILLAIGLSMSIFYYFYLKYYEGFYFNHFYDYYARAVVICEHLKMLHFSSAVEHCLNGVRPDKILIYKSIPFFLLFGPSQFVFFYSNVFFNLLLLLILFHSLLKIMQADRAFYLTLFILSQYFFIELLASFYVDLSIFLMYSIFFIYLSLFDKQPEKYNIRLVLIIFFLFLIKNVSYILIPILGILFIIYFLLSKNKSIFYVPRFLIILGFGFLIYYTFCLGFNYHRLLGDIDINHIHKVSDYFYTKGLTNNFNFINKFPFYWLNVLIYPIVIFTYYKNRDRFWIFLFLVSEIFFFSLYNLIGHHHNYRFFLPFYFVYLYFIYQLTFLLFNKILKKNYANKFFVLIIFAFFLTSFIRLLDSKNNYTVYCGIGPHGGYGHWGNLLARLPMKSTVYLASDPSLGTLYGGFIDSPEYDYSYLSEIDPRFKYKIVDNIKNAGYIFCTDYSNIKIEGYKLIASEGEDYLFKIK